MSSIAGGDSMALSEERKRKNYEYFKDNWRQVKLSMPNSEAAALEDYCKRHNLSKAGFIRNLIKSAISADDPGKPTGGILSASVEGSGYLSK